MDALVGPQGRDVAERHVVGRDAPASSEVRVARHRHEALDVDAVRHERDLRAVDAARRRSRRPCPPTASRPRPRACMHSVSRAWRQRYVSLPASRSVRASHDSSQKPRTSYTTGRSKSSPRRKREHRVLVVGRCVQDGRPHLGQQRRDALEAGRQPVVRPRRELPVGRQQVVMRDRPDEVGRRGVGDADRQREAELRHDVRLEPERLLALRDVLGADAVADLRPRAAPRHDVEHAARDRPRTA